MGGGRLGGGVGPLDGLGFFLRLGPAGRREERLGRGLVPFWFRGGPGRLVLGCRQEGGGILSWNREEAPIIWLLFLGPRFWLLGGPEGGGVFAKVYPTWGRPLGGRWRH